MAELTQTHQRHSLFRLWERLGPGQKLLPYVLLLSVTFALYGPSLFFNFVWDDHTYIQDNYRIQGLSPAHLRAIWTHTFLGQYAPLHHTLLAVIYSFAQRNPFGYHLAQLLLHAACVCLLYLVLKKIESTWVALLATLLFAVYAPNTEVVAWVSETKSTLALLFFLLSFWAFLRLRARERWSDGLWCAVCLILSLLAKMSTIVAPAIFLLYDYKQGYAFKKGRAWSLACFFFIAVVFTAIHLASSYERTRGTPEILVDATLTDIRLPHSYASSGYFGGVTVHVLNFARFLLFYVRMIFFPRPLAAWHMFRVFGNMNWEVGAAWIALLALLWLLYRSPRELQFWQLWFYLFLAPVLQIFPNAIWVADRYLYIPAIGAFVLASRFFVYVSARLGKWGPRLAWQSVLAAVLIIFAWQTHTRLPVWQNDLIFWAATTKTCMTSAYCHASFGGALEMIGRPELAARELFQAVQLRPAPRYLIYLGDVYSHYLGDYQRALRAYSAAVQSGLGVPSEFWGKVARTYYLAGDLERAGRAVEAGQKINPDDPGLLVASGFLQWRKGNWEQAKRSLHRLLFLNLQTSNAASLIANYWGNAGEVNQLLADLSPL